MTPLRFVMIGGFLGAGKTTTIGRLARAYQDEGLNVGIVTNDQAADLVDTHLLRSQGFDVGEVAGACFCCNFNELTSTVERLSARQRPDLVLAEPVGSCTDLAATVLQPLQRLFGGEFDVAPYGVILKPSHGRKILSGGQSGFSPQAAYIFTKQLEEADFFIVNRVDELSPAEIDDLCALLEQSRPGVPVVRMSAKTGQGFAGLLEMLAQQGAFGRHVLELDYDTYAEGEAELGWLNAAVRVVGSQPLPLDRLVVDVIERLQPRLAALGAETAHVKTIALWEGYHAVANLVASDAPAALSLPSHQSAPQCDLVVNARVAIDPELLRSHVDAAVTEACQSLGATAEIRQLQAFRPGRPVPTHRFADV